MTSKTITLSLRDDVERKFRSMAAARYGHGKGFMSRFLTDAIEGMSSRHETRGADAKLLELIEKGPFGKGLIRYKSRDELHER